MAGVRARLMLRARSISSRLMELSARLRPPRAQAVVHGWPASEGNAVEVVRALADRYRGRVYWLVDDPENWDIEAPPTVTVLRKSSLRAMRAFVRAEAVFFTHGLYGDVRPARSQAFVNLWHGDGPKTNRDAAAAPRPLFPSTFLVGGTRLFTERKADDFKVSRDSILLTGNPRVDQFRRPPTDLFRERTGVHGRPYVVWMPTYRTRAQVGVAPGGHDVQGAAMDVLAAARPLFAQLAERGIAVLVRRHPADAAAGPVGWATELSDDLLGETRTTLYSALGGSAGLVTDYSSVWTDYLLLDRPIAFYSPDRQAYAGGRGLYPSDVQDWLPGIDLLAPGAPAAFADEILVDRSRSAALREAARAKLGLVEVTGSAEALLAELDARGVWRRSGGLGPSRGSATTNAFRRRRG